MNRREIEDIYPLSPMQQGMLFHTLYAPETSVYFEQSHWILRGALDQAAFCRAWQQVVDRHTALRTAFVWEGLDEPLQVVHRTVELPIRQEDWRGLPAAEQEARLDAFLRADRERGFDLSRAPLMRLGLLRVAEETTHIVASHHHMLLDGWSMPLIFQDLFAFYEAARSGKEIRLAPARPYRDAIAWLRAQDPSQAEAFWRQALQGFTTPTPLPVERTVRGHRRDGDPVEQEEYRVLESRLPRALAADLQAFSRRHQITPNTLLQGAWALLLGRYSGEDDVLFGATVSGRPAELPGADRIVGLFINTLPVRVPVRPETGILPWLRALQEEQAEARHYGYASLTQIQGWSEVPRDLSLFESLLVFENYPIPTGEVGGASSGASPAFTLEEGRSFTRTNYPLTLAVSPGREILFELAFDTRCFAPEAMTRMLGHLQTLLEGIVADPERRLGDLPLLTEAERHQILVEWNRTERDFPRDRCLHELFAEQAQRAPGAIAVSSRGRAWSYCELDRRANQLAHALIRRGVGPETLVGLCVERSPEMIVGLLGILKAGGGFLPLDPAYPPERLAFMLEDSGAPLLLTRAGIWGAVSPLPEGRVSSVEVLCLDTEGPAIARESENCPPNRATPENLAYCIYTSGSTGRPKGVVVPHRALVNHALALRERFDLTCEDRLVQFVSPSFDAAYEEIFPTLLGGARLVLPPAGADLSGREFLRWCEAEGITHLHLPAAFWHAWVADLAGEDLPVRLPLKLLLVGGETPSVEALRRWGRRLDRHVRFLNAYGPTETTITATLYETCCGPEVAVPTGPVPIGRPISNVRVYLLDVYGQPVPIGVPGELHIGGAGVARGYLNRPELTAERFVEHPFPAAGNGRLYRTGDRARWRADGSLEYLGRVDEQVKVRGFRVEPGEIEAALVRHPALREVAVLVESVDASSPDAPARGDRLVALVVPRDADAAPDAEELRCFLKELLPAYMLPSLFVPVEALPRLPNGKIDRKARPWLDQNVPESGPDADAPRTPVEDLLAGIWADLLGRERVGMRESFFDLGGHSLLATRLVSRVREAFGVELPLRSLFEAPTVGGLAARIEALREHPTAPPPLASGPRDGDLPLSFAQQRLWFLDQLAPGNLFSNIPIAVRLQGRLDVTALARALHEVVRRHEALRTTFATRDGLPVQVIAPELALALPLADLGGLPEGEREREVARLAAEEARQPFDLERGPLIRARLLRLEDREHVAVVVLHHIVADGWSMHLLIRELAACYHAFTTDTPVALPELPVQYADFARWQRQWLQGEALEAQLDYWKKQLSGDLSLLDLPFDRPRPSVQTASGQTLTFTLPASLSRALRDLGRQEGATLFMTLLAAFQALLYRYTGQEEIRVGTPIAGRHRAEVEGLIGFFVNTLVMRADLSGEPSFRELLARVREVALGAYAHQDLPFEMLVEALQPQRDLSHTPLFQVMFVLDQLPEGEVGLPGLTLSPIEVEAGTAAFDLTLSLTDTPEGLAGYFQFNTDLFDRETIERMATHFRTLLDALLADPDRSLAALPLLSPQERHQLLVAFNDTAAPFPDAPFHRLFALQAQHSPHAPALSFEGHSLSYDLLNRRANQLAHHLLQHDVRPGALVGICLERSFDLLVALLAVLKAGAAYLPLDPSYPQQRLAFMLDDAQVPLVLTHRSLRDRLPHQGGDTAPRLLCLDADAEAIAAQPQEDPGIPVTLDHLAYCIYTSGSTGRPKGALLAHRGLVNLAAWQQPTFDLRPGDRVLQFAPFSFDASVWETVMALAHGATLCLAPQERLASPPALLRLLQEEGITHVTLPPSLLLLLSPAELPALRVMVVAGEACPAELARRWARGRAFYNAYGPTETTVCASCYRCGDGEAGPPPIGRPIANTRLYVLDRWGQPAPMGVWGEIYVGGVSLARGYLKRAELTQERFVTSPLGEGERLYRTGDRGRYRRDGNLEFGGRVDEQVKVRGYRIEPGEIEGVLREHGGVEAVAVVVREERLVAYVVGKEGKAPESGELRRFLRERLPEYLVPGSYVQVEGLPTTPSGKVDRGALPEPARERGKAGREYEGPRTETEREVAGVWEGVLGVQGIGVEESFFELGGHSLLATQAVTRVRERLGVEVELRTLFEHPTVADFALAVEEARARSARPSAPAIVPLARERYRVTREDLAAPGGLRRQVSRPEAGDVGRDGNSEPPSPETRISATADPGSLEAGEDR